LSFGFDRSWRTAVIQELALEGGTGMTVLDSCCGTGDLALELAPYGRCVACDFTWTMLVRAQRKSGDAGVQLDLAAADALSLPFGDGSFDAATVAFGVRNMENLEAGLDEMYRVLKPGGKIAILEFSHPTAFWLKWPYRFYLRVLLPRIGQLLSRRGSAYQYLAESIIGFPDPETLVSLLGRAGFESTRYRRLTGGIVAVHCGRRPASSASRSGSEG
jgi:demethylmenaquinone methyltransferase/2-methoxy-6-polyprenyl-1,4-benzoquinol methylase